MADAPYNPQAEDDRVKAEELAGELLAIAFDMLAVLDDRGLNPFADSKHMLVLQMLGPVCSRMLGEDPAVETPRIVQLAAQLDLSVLQQFHR